MRFALQAPQQNLEVYVEKLYESGCDDALIGIGSQGYISLDFLRTASSPYEAISTAIFDVKRVISTCILLEVGPDLVGLTDVAKIFDCSRQNIRKLIVTPEPNAPHPVYTGTPSIWHLADILLWLKNAKSYQVDDTLIEVASISMAINTASNWQKLEPKLQKNLQVLVAMQG